ncbi:MAG TPA: sigma-70 family RNA polymerase sigma factor [Thermoleophilia bacterium]|nr:sigma-70 family RNA polymerase sigma factor [Thermoleophilia bacterium]HET6494700.1 sigma-70 family RNA polymerase sigma factor [Thermoleophilia bacterium]
METDAQHEEEREIDARVVAQASHGDRAAFTAIVHHYERRLRVLAYQILQDPQAMDDALQEVFVAAYAALPGFRGDAALGTWLHRITCNVCLQSLRTASRRPAIADDPPEDNDLPAREETAAVIDRAVIAEALTALPAEQRILVLLVDRDGYDYRTAADLVGIPRGTVASRLAGGRAALRNALGLGTGPTKEGS